MKNRTYTKIQRDLNNYTYCHEGLSIYKEGKEDVACLFDLYGLFREDEDFTKFPVDTRIDIAKYIVMAYEAGIKHEKLNIKKRINKILDLCEEVL